jgi:sarcosine oxidase subunit alpha
MSEGFFITVNGKPVRVTTATSVVAAVMRSNEPFGTSVHGEPRGPLCGMGICMECRATVNGVPHRQCCRLFCEPEMEVVTE